MKYVSDPTQHGLQITINDAEDGHEKDNEAGSQNTNPEPSRPSSSNTYVVTNKVGSDTNNDDTNGVNTKNSDWRNPVTIAALATALFTGILTAATVLLWKNAEAQRGVMQETLEHMQADAKTQATQFSDQLSVANKHANAAVKASQAFVVIESASAVFLDRATILKRYTRDQIPDLLPNDGANFVASFSLRNIGKSPAQRVTISGTLSGSIRTNTGLDRFNDMAVGSRPNRTALAAGESIEVPVCIPIEILNDARELHLGGTFTVRFDNFFGDYDDMGVRFLVIWREITLNEPFDLEVSSIADWSDGLKQFEEERNQQKK